MIVLDYFGQQLEWVWAIVFVHGPYGTEESFINFEPNYNNCNQRLVNNESNICDTKLFGAKLSVLNKWCQIHPAPEPIENVQVWEKRASSNLEIIGLFYLTVHFTDAPKDPRRSSVQQ